VALLNRARSEDRDGRAKLVQSFETADELVHDAVRRARSFAGVRNLGEKIALSRRDRDGQLVPLMPTLLQCSCQPRSQASSVVGLRRFSGFSFMA